MFTHLKFKNGTITIAQYIFLITTSMYAVVLTFLLAMNVSDIVLDRFERDESNNIKIIRYFAEKKKNSDSTKDTLLLKGSSMTESINKIHKLIYDTKLSLIENIEGVDEKMAMQYILLPHAIQNKSNYDMVNRILWTDDHNGIAKSLKEEVEKFRKSATSINQALSQSINILLDTSDKEINGEVRTWEEINFKNNMIIGTMTQLDEIEKNVRMIEALVNRN